MAEYRDCPWRGFTSGTPQANGRGSDMWIVEHWDGYNWIEVSRHGTLARAEAAEKRVIGLAVASGNIDPWLFHCFRVVDGR